MALQNKENGIITLSSEQSLGEVQYGSFSVEIPEKNQEITTSLGYRRCNDFDKGNEPGQDFAAVRGGEGYIVGIVADGVSQSFYGEIAAQHVSELLLDVIWNNRENAPDADHLIEKLKGLEVEVSSEVENYSIPDYLPPIQRKALEIIRKKGSQAVFAAFVFDVRKGRIYLYQVGDVTALIHHPDGNIDTVKARPDGRWSTAGRSNLHLLLTTLEDVNGILIKSDGVSPDWGMTLDAQSLNESAFHDIAESLAGADDVSFVAAVRYKRENQESPQFEIKTTTMPNATQRLPYNFQLEASGGVEPYSWSVAPGALPEGLTITQDGIMSGHPTTIGTTPFTVNVEDSLLLSTTRSLSITVIPPTERQTGYPITHVDEQLPEPLKRFPRDMILFVAGVVVGVAAVLTYLLIMRTHVPEKTGNGNSKTDPPVALTVTDHAIYLRPIEITQKEFSDRYRTLIPRQFKKGILTGPGEIIAHIAVDGLDLSRIEFFPEQQKAIRAIAAADSSDGAGKALFALIPGMVLQGETSVAVRVWNEKNVLVYDEKHEMRGRQPLSGKETFLGYYEIQISSGTHQ